MIVTKYSLVNRADSIKVSPFDTDEIFTADKFVAVDRINDLIILKVDDVKRPPIELFSGTAPQTAKTSYLSVQNSKSIQIFTFGIQTGAADTRYAEKGDIVGEVVSGKSVVDSIEKVETDREWRPVEDIRLNDVSILK